MVRNRRGVTLAELLIVLAIIGSVAALTPKIFTSITKLFVLGRAKVALQGEARNAMALITRDLRQAQSATIVIDQPAGQPYYSRISFTRGDGTAVSFWENGTSLFMAEGPTTSTLSKDLAYLAFTFPRSDDMTIVSVSLTLQVQIYGGALKALHMASEKVRVMN